jgi:molybdopterin-guanine dinucleotide biosynthesis protein A
MSFADLTSRARSSVTGLVLAGGQSTRMGGGDKALLDLGGRPMLAHVVGRLKRQVARSLLNANGDPERFAGFGLPVVADPVPGLQGPLAGVLAGMRWAETHAPGATDVLSVSADAPFLPHDLAVRLLAAREGRAGIACAACDGRLHHVIALWPVALAGEIEAALSRGEHAVGRIQERLGVRRVEFPALMISGKRVDPFFNVNTPEELALARRLVRRPAIGIAGWKSSGKTTLVARLVETLTRQGYRVATVKHSHHDIVPGDRSRDSDRHAAAGAVDVAVVSPRRWMLGTTVHDEPEPPLAEILALLAPSDVVLVEGFKGAAIAKIEVRRQGQGDGPPLAEADPHVIAIAADHAVACAHVPVLALDDVEEIARMIIGVAGLASEGRS